MGLQPQVLVLGPKAARLALGTRDGTTTGETDNLERAWWRQWPAGQSLSDMDFHFLPDNFNVGLKREDEDIMRSRTIDIRSEWFDVWDCGKEEQEKGAGCKERGGSLHCTLRHTTITSSLVGRGCTCSIATISEQL